ncbi:hypothetical protein QMK19_20660 [Streptomyces sp. H10-C2]|uniref:hypothetical protein n=1 Tax=unclassified Streptomyces TaxID=2593676 RepID=UPI0024B915B4|nr:MULTISPECIES: hypothetical protein [unclassified Streptomyces]MDJ0340703.1 hypothetical protein [Streptomyces sp. PH10-H1]MDJ0372025.1 hypothetical protein [Streptomyces sp. H10-C2]
MDTVSTRQGVMRRRPVVDLSQASLTAGLTRNVPELLRSKLSAHRADVRHGDRFLPGGGVQFAFLGGNSLGTSPI